jgi:hypothetical protein
MSGSVLRDKNLSPQTLENKSKISEKNNVYPEIRVVYMTAESLKRLSLISLFVFLFSALGFLVAVLLNAIFLYSESASLTAYEYLIETKLFTFTSVSYYLLTAVLFAGLALLIIYRWKKGV